MGSGKDKRILFVVPFLSGGGAERVVSIWSNKLVEIGFDVHLLVFYRVQSEYMINSKVLIHTIAENKDQYKKISNIGKILKIRSYIKKLNPNFVMPFVTYVGVATNIARIGLRVNLIETIRNSPWAIPNKSIDKLKRNLSVFFSDACIVQNREQLKYFSKIKSNKMFVVSNPLSEELILNKKNFPAKRIKNVITIGRLEPQKNHRLLIEAFSRISQEKKDITLRIFGEGSQFEELNELIFQLNMEDKIKLCGRTDDIISVLQNSDLFVLSSDFEGMPNALMEAMALGLPCISTKCLTGPSDLINNGYNGLLVPVNNKEELEKSMNKLIDNPTKAIKMGENARESITQCYSAENSINNLIKVFNNLIR